MKKNPLAEYLQIIPTVLFLALAGIFSTSRTSDVFEPPLLLPLLNSALLSALPFTIAFFAAKGYADQGSRIFVLFGCGMVASSTSLQYRTSCHEAGAAYFFNRIREQDWLLDSLASIREQLG